MKQGVRTIVLYGGSLSVAALAAGIELRPDWRVVRAEPPQGEGDRTADDAHRSLRRLHPDVLLFDVAATQPESVLSLLRDFPGLLLIGIDLAEHRALVLSGQQPRLLTPDDLVHLIEERPAALREAVRGAGGAKTGGRPA